MWESVLTAALGLLGTALILGAAMIIKRVNFWLAGKTAKTFHQDARMTRVAVTMDKRINLILTSLVNEFQATRAAVFQYHNGEVFLMSGHKWKVTCSHEATAPGVTHMYRATQDLLVSQMTDWMEPAMTGNVEGVNGVELVDSCPCGENCAAIKAQDKWVVRYVTDEMDPCVPRYIAEELGIAVSYSLPLFTKPENEKDVPAVFGNLVLHFRTELEDTVKRKNTSGVTTSAPCTLCAAAEQIQFMLVQNPTLADKHR